MGNIMTYEYCDQSREILSITGGDAKRFLQDLVTNDIEGNCPFLKYSAILSPQGKYLFDFFIWATSPTHYLLDIEKDRVPELRKKLNMYRLRSDVKISETDLRVLIGVGATPEGGFPDPRNEGLGFRKIINPRAKIDKKLEVAEARLNFEFARIDLKIPRTGYELVPDSTYILEVDFERIKGVSFTKGCFVGQEVTARMKHKGSLKSGLVKFSFDSDCEFSDQIILNDSGKQAGILSSYCNGKGLGVAKFRNLTGKLFCSGHEIIAEEL